MKKHPILLFPLLILVLAGAGCGLRETVATSLVQETAIKSDSFRNLTLTIDGNPVTLVDGLSQGEAAPGSAQKIVTRIFGNEAYGDLDGDGREDVAFLVTQQGGGSGTFFYVSVALATDAGYRGTNALLLGDRIAPQGTRIENGLIIVNYADRKPDEPMSAQPSVGVSRTFRVVGVQLIEVINTEGGLISP